MKKKIDKFKAMEERIRILEEKLILVNAKANHIRWGWSEEIVCERCGTTMLDTRNDCPISGPLITCRKCGEATYHFRRWDLKNNFLEREYRTIKKLNGGKV